MFTILSMFFELEWLGVAVSNNAFFDKKAMADSVDEGNNFDNRKVIVHARNSCFEIAKELGITNAINMLEKYCE